MKRFILTVLMLAAILPLWAHDFEVDGIFYKITSSISTNRTVEVTYKGSDLNNFKDEYTGTVTIPSSVTYNGNTYKVVGVSGNAFKYCPSLKSVSIPSSVTTLGQGSFCGTGLTSINIPSTVTTIGQDAFNSCSSLKTAYIGGGKVESSAFYYATSLEEVTIGNSVTEIGSFAFDDCNIKKVTIEGTAKPTVDVNAFRKNGISSSGAILVVPVGRLSEFQGKEEWQYFEIMEATKTLKLNYTTAGMFAGETFTLKATLLPDNVQTTNVTWRSSNESVATVKQGVVTAHKEGTVEITATTADGSNLSATCIFTILPNPDLKVAGIVLDKTSTSLYTGQTVTLKATVYPETAVNKTLEWKSSNSNIASVTSAGVVTAHKVGTVDITATSTDGSNVSAVCKISIYPVEATGVSLNKTTATLKAGETVNLWATVSPSNATNKTVKWSSTDETVATVSSGGLVTALKIGSADITATTTDGTNKSAVCKVSVVATPVTSISLNKTSATLKATETVTLTATVSPSDATNKKITWSSSDSNIASVTSDGVVTAHKVGSVNITAKSSDGTNVTAVCKITVAATPVTAITLNKTSVTLEATDTYTLTATVSPSTASNKTVTWTSSNESVATVSSTGVVTAIKVGTANITAKSTDGSNISAVCKVTVAATPVTSIVINKTTATMKVSETLSLTASVWPSDATNKNITWSSSDETVATVVDGVVTAHKVGTADIKATAADGSNVSAVCKVTVAATPVSGITLSKTAATLKASETLTLTASVSPSTATNKNVTWSSSDETVATVSSTGVVTAIKVGTANITAKSTDGSNVSAACKVTVAATPVSGITLSKTAATLKASETLTLTASVTPSTATNKNITWSSSDETVATVVDGVVTAHKVGTADIKATAADGSNVSAVCKVTVAATPVSGITLSKTAATLKASETLTLTASVSPSTATNKNVTWSSSDETVATVVDGVVTAHKVGTADIKATAADGSNVSAVCKVTVAATPVSGITLSKTAATLKASETLTLTASVSPSTATNKNVTWSSSDASVASVSSSGVVTAHKVGTADIKATASDGSNVSAVCKITVERTVAESLTLDKTAVTLKATESVTLTAKIMPDNTTNKELAWTSSDETVATVVDGVVTAHNVGTAMIIVSTTDGSNLTAICNITVERTVAESLTLDKTAVTLKAAESVTLTAQIMPDNTTNKELTWISSDESVVTVLNGVLTAHKIGTANIIVSTTDGSNLTAICKVTVEPTPAERVEIKTPETTTIIVGETLQLEAVVYPETATDKSVTWVSTNVNVATIDENGVVTGVSEGTVKIIVIDSFGHSANIELEVEAQLVESLELDKTVITAKEGEQVTLVANILPLNATNKELKWSVDDENIVSIESNGNEAVVSILKEGTATIIVETTDGSGLVAICSVNALSGIGEILADDKEEAVYYTLDGIMVAKENLIPGLYIKKTATKTVKVVIK